MVLQIVPDVALLGVSSKVHLKFLRPYVKSIFVQKVYIDNDSVGDNGFVVLVVCFPYLLNSLFVSKIVGISDLCQLTSASTCSNMTHHACGFDGTIEADVKTTTHR